MAGIYIHVPFCKQKCTYCDFASYPREIQKAELYFGLLYKEAKSRSMEVKDKTFDTVYFGGGTPSFVDPKYILGCMRLLKKYYTLSPDAEVTLEVNPGTIDRNKLRVYKQAGINRFSIGLQTADDDILRSLNRVHTTEDFVRAAEILKDYNFSADVMIGLPGQTSENVKKTIDLAVLCGAKHISVYALKPEEGTPMYSKYLNGDLPDGDTVADFYDFSEGDFDKIVIFNAYPHFTDTQAFLTAINKNLKKGGEFSIIHSDPPSVINARHSGGAKIVSKDLESADEESNIFKELFDIVQTVDDGEKYLIRGKKR